MNLLSVDSLSKTFGDKLLFRDLYFGLGKGEKIALIANNGTGKSTLLKILVGKETADSGIVTLRKGIRIGYLDQHPQFDENKTINDLVQYENTRITDAVRQYEKALEDQAADYNDKTHKAFVLASEKMDELDAWDYERKLKSIFNKFGLIHLGQKISQLSGGQKKRLALALLLIDNPELIILDEPTNHLDVEMVEWLEEYLINNPITLLMVTHDRYFLERVCNTILELSEGKMYKHEGNYSYFLQKKEEREQVYNVELGKTRQLYKSELEWIRKMPKARTTKSKSRIDAFHDIKDKAFSRKKTEDLRLEVKMSRIGGKVLEMKKVYKQFGELKILQGFDYTFKSGERIGIVGKNGVGKTTFLNMVTGTELPDSGKINTGETIVYGYYSQQGMVMEADKKVIDIVREIADVIVMSDGRKVSASQFLQYFMFPPEMQYIPVSKLSGGEKRRLYLLTVLIKNPNFLILDEPTNDLDLLTLNKLEEFLSGFGGCLLIVSHDRYFMDKLADTLFVFEGNGKIKNYTGLYSEYRNEVLEEEEQSRESVKEKSEAAKPENREAAAPNKLSYKEKREYENLEDEIKKLELEKAELELAIQTPENDFEKLQAQASRLTVVMNRIDEKSIRWLELSEKIG